MSPADENRIERRSAQRFPFQLPVALKSPGQANGAGFTQDLSARGAMIWTDFPVSEGQVIEMTLVMPAEITLTEEMTVRCRARVLRRECPEADRRAAIALRFEHYEYLVGASAAVESAREIELSARHS